mmetsp:Transcript_17136/g.42814  ORF Transcript_17136/g.42814 Transcript_17136/m.42814 type:complete len:95 (-) Transcript_17136:102-386(-)
MFPCEGRRVSGVEVVGCCKSRAVVEGDKADAEGATLGSEVGAAEVDWAPPAREPAADAAVVVVVVVAPPGEEGPADKDIASFSQFASPPWGPQL